MSIVEHNVKLSPEIMQEIDQWITKYPSEQKRSAVMAALRIVQDAHGGWLTEELVEEIARYLDIPAIAVYEVATFYSMYELRPVGKHKLCVCTNISCMINGSDAVIGHLGDRLGISPGETTSDGQFTLKEVECLGACGGAPMMQIDRQYYENLTPAKIDEILNGFKSNTN